MLSTKLNDSFRAAFLLLGQGRKFSASPRRPGFTPGDFIVTGVSEAQLVDIAKRTGVDFVALKQAPAGAYCSTQASNPVCFNATMVAMPTKAGHG